MIGEYYHWGKLYFIDVDWWPVIGFREFGFAISRLKKGPWLREWLRNFRKTGRD